MGKKQTNQRERAGKMGGESKVEEGHSATSYFTSRPNHWMYLLFTGTSIPIEQEEHVPPIFMKGGTSMVMYTPNI